MFEMHRLDPAVMLLPSPARWLDLLSYAVILLFVALLAFALFVPLYTDEVATKIVQARFLAESGKLLSLYPQCPSGFVQDTPVTWYPAALAYSFIYYGLSPLGIRISGVLMAVLCVALLDRWLALTVPVRRDRLRSLAAQMAILSLGVLPLTLALARGEQWIALLLTSFLILPALAERLASWRGGWGAAILLISFILLTSLFSYAHPKSLFFLPVAIASAFYTFGSGNRWLLGLALGFILLCTYERIQFTTMSLRCDESPILSAILAGQTIRLGKLAEAPGEILQEVATNLVAAPRKIANHAVFKHDYQSGWLPPAPEFAFGRVVKALNAAIRAALQVVYWLGLLLPPLALQLSRAWRSANGRPLLLAALWVGLVGHLALYNEWNFYSGALVLFVIGILLIASVMRLRNLSIAGKAARLLLAPLLVLSLLSTPVLAVEVIPRLFAAAYASTDVLPGQPLSINAFGYTKARERIRALVMACGIRGDGAWRLVVDDLTYFAFADLQQPLHLIYLYEGGFGADLEGRIRDFLVDRESEGVIGQCTYLSPVLQKDALRDGNLCCVKLAIKGASQ